MATPNWNGATAGQPTLAGQINQFLGTHSSTFAYTGTSQFAQTTAGTGGTNTNGLYLAQSFVTGASAVTVSRVALTLSVTGTPPPATVSIQTNTGAAPSGTVVGAATLLPPTFVTGSATSISIPISAALGATTTYWIVVNAVGDVSNFFTWFKSNQTSGASTSPTVAVWTAQTYGFLYNIFSGTTGALLHTWEDSGARWTTFTYTAQSVPSNLQEYTTAQGTAQYVSSSRAFTYSNGLLTSIA